MRTTQIEMTLESFVAASLSAHQPTPELTAAVVELVKAWVALLPTPVMAVCTHLHEEEPEDGVTLGDQDSVRSEDDDDESSIGSFVVEDDEVHPLDTAIAEAQARADDWAGRARVLQLAKRQKQV